VPHLFLKVVQLPFIFSLLSYEVCQKTLVQKSHLTMWLMNSVEFQALRLNAHKGMGIKSTPFFSVYWLVIIKIFATWRQQGCILPNMHVSHFMTTITGKVWHLGKLDVCRTEATLPEECSQSYRKLFPRKLLTLIFILCFLMGSRKESTYLIFFPTHIYRDRKRL